MKRLKAYRLPLLLAALGAVGCGGTGDVSGTVTYRDKPLTYGTVMVVGRDGIPHQGSIGPEGAYRVTGVPAGPVRIAVYSPNPAAAVPVADPEEDSETVDKALKDLAQRRPADAGKWFPIPVSYGDINTSGLECTVNRGPNTYDLRLK